MEGKLDCRHGQINALGGLVFLQDSKTKQKFLVDTGAAVSVLPHTSTEPSSGPPLFGADGKSIPLCVDFCPQTVSWLIRILVKSWMQTRWIRFPDRKNPDPPHLSAMWHPQSAHSLPPFPPLSATDPELRIQNMAFFIPLKRREQPSNVLSPQYAIIAA